QDKSRRRFEEKTPSPPSNTKPMPIAAPMAVPPDVHVPSSLASPEEMVLTDGDAQGAALVKAGDEADAAGAALTATTMVDLRAAAQENVNAAPAQTASLHSAEALQEAAIGALTGVRNQDSAVDALSAAEWIVANGEIRVQTELSKTMLPMVINAEAEKLVKAALKNAGAGALKLVLLPGVKVEGAAKKKPKAAKTGSAQAKALEHPVVQRAQTLFNAEIRSVIDLTDND
ncbi:MAG: DNA polymerase III subunit gamma/tau, partial [Edaphobacter sp.]